MPAYLAVWLALPAALLVGWGMLPTRLANQYVVGFRRVVTGLAAIQAVTAALLAAWFATGRLPAFAAGLPLSPPGLGIYYDGVAALMLALVGFVGWVICRFSIRYLDGEPSQGRYFRWTSFTIGSVALLVLSGNLLMFFACWVMTSLGLHQLLLHYGHRAAAQRAAWSKFAISRIGDAALVGAIALLYSEFNTLDLSALFAAVQTTSRVTPAMTWAGVLLVVGAITKSAQFPFHTWLPQTMETPTPVSALMHAGIVNAGGYLIIRMSPLLQTAPVALSVLAVVGAVTAVFGAVVMLTQNSVKKQLAYSTMAQMGFMMLQCGLGAFSAAMLHILAHSLYKAHAFLSSGSVMSERSATLAARVAGHPLRWSQLATASLAIIAFFGIAMTACGVDVVAKPGGLLLGGILCLALTHWVGQVMRTGNQKLLIRSLATAAAMCFVYAIGFVAVDRLIAPSLPSPAAQTGTWLVLAVVPSGFAGLFLLHMQLSSERTSELLNQWYIHASNGFYLEQTWHRAFGRLAND